MAMTANGLTPCPGGDCHGIDHAWCAPGKHAKRYDSMEEYATFAWRRQREGVGPYPGTYMPRHRKEGPVLDHIPTAARTPLIPYLHN